MGTPEIKAKHVSLGDDVSFGDGVVIGAIGGDAESVVIGDHTYIGDGVKILAPRFSIGDYCKVHRHTLMAGYQDMRIGHNAWIGQDCVLDSTGILNAGNNLCVGAHSSLWSHMKYGDVTEGCRFAHTKPLIIGGDVWIGDSTVVTPTVIQDKVLVLANSVVSHKCIRNRIYAGVPAHDVTEKMGGPPFNDVTVERKLLRLSSLAYSFSQETGIPVRGEIIFLGTEEELPPEEKRTGHTFFIADTRRYTKRSDRVEIAFIKWLMPHKAKFTPLDDPLEVRTVVELTDGESVVGKRGSRSDSLL